MLMDFLHFNPKINCIFSFTIYKNSIFNIFWGPHNTLLPFQTYFGHCTIVCRMQLEASHLWLIRDGILYLMLCHVTLFDLLENSLSPQKAVLFGSLYRECQALRQIWPTGLWSHWPAGIVILLLNQMCWLKNALIKKKMLCSFSSFSSCCFPPCCPFCKNM